MSDFSKPYGRMTSDEKREYSKFVQNKYIKDFNEYLKIINKGRISLHKRQIIEWVEAIREFPPEVINGGWKKFIQLLRPNFVPSIKDAIDHFKAIPSPTNQFRRAEPEGDTSLASRSDFSKLMVLCGRIGELGPISFHKECIKYFEAMAAKEDDIEAKSSFKKAVREHTKLLKKAESTPEYQSVARKHEEKIMDTIEEVFETTPILRGNKSPI